MTLTRKWQAFGVATVTALSLGCGGAAAPAPGIATPDLLNPPTLGHSCAGNSDGGATGNFATPRTRPALHELELNPENGIPGEYLVWFMAGVEDQEGTARALAAKYHGSVMNMFGNWWFAVRIADSDAPAFAQEPVVCFVEQNGYAHG